MKVLIVDDEELVRKLVAEALSGRDYELWTAASGAQALELARERDFDLILCDMMMDGLSGLDVLRELRGSMQSQAEIILMTGQASVESTVEAIQYGANDYICKPFTVSVLQAIAAAVKQRRYSGHFIEIKPMELSRHGIMGNSPAMIDIVKNATRIAATDLPVMICGESGTGKELISRLIHRKSSRADKPFVALNCSALPDTLLESELFGHTRGAFTGADSHRRGLLEEAHGGTLLLDEITETSPAFQVKLLRALQEGEIQPLGSNIKKKVDVRVLSATNRDPQALIEAGLFRQDLLYRLQGVAITLPPLRQRAKDIRTMAIAFLGQFNTGGRRLSISEEALLALEAYSWPGNVRELRHMMQRLACLSNRMISLSDLPPQTVASPSVASVMNEITPEGDLPTVEEIVSTYAIKVLAAVNGNKSRAAQIMGVDRKTLYRIIHNHSARPNGSGIKGRG